MFYSISPHLWKCHTLTFFSLPGKFSNSAFSYQVTTYEKQHISTLCLLIFVKVFWDDLLLRKSCFSVSVNAILQLAPWMHYSNEQEKGCLAGVRKALDAIIFLLLNKRLLIISWKQWQTAHEKLTNSVLTISLAANQINKWDLITHLLRVLQRHSRSL